MKKFFIIIFFLIAGFLNAENKIIVNYLTIDSYPEYSAMGENIGAALNGISALNLNPASLSLIKDFEFSAMHNMWIGNMTNEKISLGKKFNFGNIGSEISYFNFGNMKKIKIDENEMPVLTNEDIFMDSFVLNLAFAQKIKDFSFGFKSGLIYERLGEDTSTYYKFDFGVIIENSFINNLKTGLSLLNISKEEDGFSLPLNLKGSFVYTIYNEREIFLILGIAGNYFIKENDLETSIGFQYNLFKGLILRSGIYFDKKFRVNLTAGCGVKIENFTINYSFEMLNDIGNINKISINIYSDLIKEKQDIKEKSGENTFENLIKSAEYYYNEKQYSKAIKYFEYINLIYWKELEEIDAKNKSIFYQKLGICYYNTGDKSRAKQYFERALFYDKENEVLKYWADLLK